MDVRPARDLVKVECDSTNRNELIVTTVPDLADHPRGKIRKQHTAHERTTEFYLMIIIVLL